MSVSPRSEKDSQEAEIRVSYDDARIASVNAAAWIQMKQWRADVYWKSFVNG